MSYTEVPDGPLPAFCTQCRSMMVQRVVEMRPLDPQTGEGTYWWVVECPMHDNSRWGTKHHYTWWKSWYHDGFKIKPVEKGFKPPKKEKPSEPVVIPWFVWVFVALMILGMVMQYLE